MVASWVEHATALLALRAWMGTAVAARVRNRSMEAQPRVAVPVADATMVRLTAMEETAADVAAETAGAALAATLAAAQAATLAAALAAALALLKAKRAWQQASLRYRQGAPRSQRVTMHTNARQGRPRQRCLRCSRYQWRPLPLYRQPRTRRPRTRAAPHRVHACDNRAGSALHAPRSSMCRSKRGTMRWV